MTEATKQKTIGGRLPAQGREQIDRAKIVKFAFDGKVYEAHPGDTIASALLAAGVDMLSRSFKYHRPRGVMCAAGHCPNCLVQVGDDPNVRACTTLVENDMIIEPQNVSPSLDFDLMAATQVVDRALPVGFYYKTFIRPASMWPTYEHFLRNAAGLGKVNADTPAGEYGKQYLHGDVAVIGGGPAGLSAALAAGQQGARVLLFDDGKELGGHALFTGSHTDSRISKIILELHRLENVQIFSSTTVIGFWEENWLGAMSGNQLYKIRSQSVVFATGAFEKPVMFGNNDLPGIMLGSAAQRLMQLHSVKLGNHAFIATTNDEGWDIAKGLLDAGISLAGIADERDGKTYLNPIAHDVAATGVPVFWQHTIKEAKGRRRVSGVVVSPMGRGVDKSVSCDLLITSLGWSPANGLLYQAGVKAEYDHLKNEFLPPQTLPNGIFVAGRIAGTHDLATELIEGRLAGLSATAYLGMNNAPTAEEHALISAHKSTESKRTSGQFITDSRKKKFLCYCEDVTDKDIKTAIAEGYNSMELLKRYSTVSMGPCQGKMCNVNAIHLCAKVNNWTIEETGTTTSRPPTTPVKMGVLGGQLMEPVQYTPIHQWHIANGAKMMNAGLWKRAEHYGNPVAEVKAVRERVGLIDVSTLGKMRLTGAGVPDFLDKIYVNQWQNLGVGRVRYGLMCNAEGVVMDDGVTARINENEFYMSTTSGGADSVYEWMQWWAQSGWGNEVNITNVTENFAAFNLAGPESRAVLMALTNDDVSNEAFPYMHWRKLELAGVDCRLLRIGFTGELSYEIHCPSGYALHLWEAIMAAGEAFGISPFGVEAQRVLRLEKAHIIVGQDTDALTDPVMLDMGGLVKMGKADFLGQRAIARISAEGVKQRLVGFEMVTPRIVPDEGLQIVKQGAFHKFNILGWVTSSRYSPTLDKTIGLCWLAAEIAEEHGSKFTIRMNQDLLVAKVHHGAFYDVDGARLRG